MSSALRRPVLHRAVPRRPRPFVAVVPALAAALGVPAGAGPVTASERSPQLGPREQAVLSRINAVRDDHDLSPLVVASGIARAADRHSQRSLRQRRLGHQVAGEAPMAQRVRRAARRRVVGEVVLWASRGAGSAAIVRTWMRSPSHRELLLSPRFGRAGVAIRAGRDGLYATVDLAER